MAKTYTFRDAWDLVRRQVRSDIEADHTISICNLALNEVWNSFDWRVSLSVLPPFYLIPSEQDHGAPAVSVPSDFQGLREAWLVFLTSEPAYRVELSVMKDLRLTHYRSIPHAIAYEPSKSSFRLFPRTPESFTAPNYVVDGIYKKLPVKVTSTSFPATTLPFDDVYFSAMVEAVKWAALRTMGSEVAGGVQIRNNGARAYVGQYAVMKERLEEMAQTEAVDLGNPSIAPRDSYPRARLGGVSSAVNLYNY